jgi:hypothetical protein
MLSIAEYATSWIADSTWDPTPRAAQPGVCSTPACAWACVRVHVQTVICCLLAQA